MAIPTETYYRTYGPMVLRRCRFLLRDEDQARDAMHDVFVQLLLHEHDLDGRAPSSLLYRIATNLCLNRIRARHRVDVDGDDVLSRIAAAGDDASRASARSVLRRLFGDRDDSSAAMAVMHLLDGMTLEEVAAEVGMSVSGVRKRLRGLREAVIELQEV